MVTIANLVEKHIAERPFLQEALVRGIVNNAALAEELRPKIAKELKKKVTFSAVNMAIRRLGEKIKGTFIQKTTFTKEADITIMSDLVEITVYKVPHTQHALKKVYSFVDFRKGDMLTVTQGLHEIMLITNKRHEQAVLAEFSVKDVKKVIKKLSSVTINIPLSAVETVGLFYMVTRALNWENINIVEIVSTLTEMTFIIKEEDTSKAFTVLKDLIDR